MADNGRIGDVRAFRGPATFPAVLLTGAAILLLLKDLYVGARLGLACAAGEIGHLFMKGAPWIKAD